MNFACGYLAFSEQSLNDIKQRWPSQIEINTDQWKGMEIHGVNGERDHMSPDTLTW